MTTFRPSLAELFVTNLRLLDLDTRSDWPNITSKAFSSKDILGQNQKNRIRCTEWALYRLFELWDPEETRDKLQPFFPPLEPLQSLNLRGALYRLLNDLKKNGVLGRETILRKTMLDECKGDKFLEILVVFSTSLVKKIAVPRIAHHATQRSASISLAAASALESAEQGSLLPLAIVHRTALSTLLQKKEDAKVRCQQFADLLNQKFHQLNNRVSRCKETDAPASRAAEAARVEKEVYENWPGHSKWPHTLLYGDDTNPGDQPLKRPFQEVWGVVIEGGTLEPTAASMGLVENLERRVNEQQARLLKWRSFHQEIAQGSTRVGELERAEGFTAQSGNLFSFQKHQNLHLKQYQSSSQSSERRKFMNPKLESIMTDLHLQLSELSKSKVATFEAPSTSIDLGSTDQSIVHEEPSAMGHTRNKSSTQGIRPFALSRSNTAVPLSRIFSPAKTFRNIGRSVSSSYTETMSNSSASVISSVPDRIEPTPPPTPKVVMPNGDIRSPTNGSVSGDNDAGSAYSGDDLAEDIISSVMNAQSPPTDGRMSLADRTRMSMLHANTSTNSRGHLHPHSAISPSREAFSATTVIANGPSVADRRASLLERTQQSMLNLNLDPRQKARHSISVKKNRQSIAYPVNQFETPGRPRPGPLRDATPTEKLFAEDAEYSSVFKSRPRVAVSPGPSPHEEDDDLPIAADPINEDVDFDSTMDVDGDSWLQSSPLRSRG